jgi:hypothetical protein
VTGMPKDYAVFIPMSKEAWADEPIRPSIRELAARQVPAGYEFLDEQTVEGEDYDPETGEPFAMFAVRFRYRYADDAEA